MQPLEQTSEPFKLLNGARGRIRVLEGRAHQDDEEKKTCAKRRDRVQVTGLYNVPTESGRCVGRQV